MLIKIHGDQVIHKSMHLRLISFINQKRDHLNHHTASEIISLKESIVPNGYW